MQYPVIDLITQAYINNGWTGLDISTGKNLFNPNNIIHGYSLDGQGRPLVSAPARFSTENPINVNGNNITLSYDFSDDITYVSFIYATFLNGNFVSRVINQSNRTTINIENVDAIAFTFYSGSTDINNKVFNIQLEYGTQATPYEPYGTFSNDFPHRLKLPLLHYFQHPVIDALKHASDGTITDNDKQILRYYLTPLGIRGI